MSEKEGKGKVSQGRVPNRTQVAWRPSSAHPQQSIPQRGEKKKTLAPTNYKQFFSFNPAQIVHVFTCSTIPLSSCVAS